MNLKAKRCILVFGGGPLQISIILKCKASNILTVVIDPSDNAPGKDFSDYFEIISGDDFEGTCKVIEKFKVNGIITSATDKPLLMMARIAEKYNFPFFSIKTAENTTDKFKMKEVFEKHSIPHAKGRLISSITSDLKFPAILKPRDNSGSRGVIFCETIEQANLLFNEVKNNTKLDSILYEEFITGREYSIEAIHNDNETIVVQFTEKITTEFPYNVELGHVAPAKLSDKLKNKISFLIDEIAKTFEFKNCASHTEIKINDKGEITVIETSPRLGGDFITSDLVPLSTSFDIERSLIDLCLGKKEVNFKSTKNYNSGIFYFDFPPNKHINKTLDQEKINFQFEKLYLALEINDIVPKIKSSLDRYGYIIIRENTRDKLFSIKESLFSNIENQIF